MIVYMRLRSNNGWSSDSPETFTAPPDFESFINDSGGSGFVLVSFGSYVRAVLGKEKIAMVATALGKLKQRVLWKLNEGNSASIHL